MSASKVIKRYANRKLYDTERSCYVTLDDISAMIKSGEELRVIDNKNGEDLTTVTYAQIIFEAEKKNNFMPKGLLRDIIRGSGDAIGEFAREQADIIQARAHDFRESAEKLRDEWKYRIDGVIARKAEKPDPTREGDAPTEAEQRHRVLLEMVQSAQKAFDELQNGVEQRIKGSVGAVSRYAHLDREMDEISKRLAALEQRLEKMG